MVEEIQRESRYIASPGGELIHLINTPVAVIERLEPEITIGMDRKFFKQCMVVEELNKIMKDFDAGQEYVRKLREEKEARDAHRAV